MSKVLVTGGAGYIGSHVAVELLRAGRGVVILDDLSNSSERAIDAIKQITGKELTFYRADLADKSTLNTVFEENNIDAAIHLAGYKAVGESVEKPLMYYQNNIGSTLALLEVMESYNVRDLIFSSSATVYAESNTSPISEDGALSAINPYGRTKLFIEEILRDVVSVGAGWKITSLRYFNPIGAHSSGLIGENPKGIPNNLLPYIMNVAAGELEKLMVFGNDYDTLDGTGVRDYIHVVDLAKAHVAALNALSQENIYKAYNIGTGKGRSVLQMLQAVNSIIGRDVPYEIAPRRSGDVAICYASPKLASIELGWKSKISIEQAIYDSWNWKQSIAVRNNGEYA